MNTATENRTAFEQMNRMYRYQRHIYDISRKFYLYGRDYLISKIEINPDSRVLEIGCGTGRNLLILAKKYPQARFYGIDASSEMLKTAQTQINSANIKNISLKLSLADDFTYQSLGLDESFDVIFFSFSISMIEDWRQALAVALENLNNRGVLYIVDFSDRKDLPTLFQRILTSWLKMFHVRHRAELLPHFEELQSAKKGTLEIRQLARRYSFFLKFRKENTRAEKITKS